MKKQSIVAIVTSLAFALSASPALAVGQGYGGHDNCRDGIVYVKNGKLKCKERKENNGNHAIGNTSSGKSNSASVVNGAANNRFASMYGQIMAMLSKIMNA